MQQQTEWTNEHNIMYLYMHACIYVFMAVLNDRKWTALKSIQYNKKHH